MAKCFELTDEIKVNDFGVTLHRIRCTRDTCFAKVGDLGGWVESELNLSDDAWVDDEAQVFGGARVSSNAWVYDNAQIYGNAWVSDNAQIFGDARVYGNAHVCGRAKLCGSAAVENDDQFCGFDGFGSENRHTFAYLTESGGVEVICGCFRGSLNEFVQQVRKTHGGTIYERQYMALVEVIKIKFGL